MTVEITPDEWLAARLDRPSYRVALAETIAAANLQKELHQTADDRPAFAYAKVPADAVEILSAISAAGFDPVSVNLQFDRLADREAPTGGDIEVTEARSGDSQATLDIAAQAFTYDRFHLDPAVDDKRADDIKREWIANYFRGNRGQEIYVARWDGEPVGFLADIDADVPEGQARVIDLIGVSSDDQNRGIGSALVNHFTEATRDECDIHLVGTQAANTPSIRFYEKLGFRQREAKIVFHSHLTEPVELP